MLVAPRSVNSTTSKSSPQKPFQRSRRGRQNRASGEPLRRTRRQVEHLPNHPQGLPFWLRGFLFLEQSSALVAFCAIAATLAMYAWTVYIPQIWTKEYKTLTTLQSHERHLTVANEASKDSLARQAENPRSGLIEPNSQNSLIVLPAAPESTSTPPNPLTSNQNKLPIVNHPLAY